MPDIYVEIEKATLFFGDKDLKSTFRVFTGCQSYTSWQAGLRLHYDSKQHQPSRIDWQSIFVIHNLDYQGAKFRIICKDFLMDHEYLEYQGRQRIALYCNYERFWRLDTTSDRLIPERLLHNEFLYLKALEVIQESGAIEENVVQYFYDEIFFPSWSKGYLVGPESDYDEVAKILMFLLEALLESEHIKVVNPVLAENTLLEAVKKSSFEMSHSEKEELLKDFSEFLTKDLAFIVYEIISKNGAREIMAKLPNDLKKWLRGR